MTASKSAAEPRTPKRPGAMVRESNVLPMPPTVREPPQATLASPRSGRYFPAMILEELRSLLRAQPFQPFSIFTGDGQEILVHHHDYAWVLRSGFQVHVESPQGRIDIINLSQITRLSYVAAQEPVNPEVVERP